MSTRNKDVARKVSKSSKVSDKITSSRHVEKEKKDRVKERSSEKNKTDEHAVAKGTNETSTKVDSRSSTSKSTKRTSSTSETTKIRTGSNSKPETKVNSSKTNSVTSKKSTTSTNNIAKLKKSSSIDSPSNRVTKIQYFPSKQMISDVVKAERLKQKVKKEQPLESSRLITATKEYDISSDNSLSIERPRTATLRKGSIVNMNIAGPEVPKAQVLSSRKENKAESSELDEYDYEDDFEAYESDFEEYNSSSKSSSISEELTEGHSNLAVLKISSSNETDEDKKLDSGNYELPEYKHKHILDNIRESIEQENVTLLSVDNRSNMASLSDEGFEDGKSMQSVPFINFLDAQKKYKKLKTMEKKRRRGEELLSMIKLDVQTFTVFDLAPIPYNSFIKMYGTYNTMQVGTQTGDDNINEEIQTDSIGMSNRWTQFPAVISKVDVNNQNYMEIYKREYSGVGSDDEKSTCKVSSEGEIKSESLEKFMVAAGRLVTTILEERNQYSLGNINGLSNVPFSNGYVVFNTNRNVLKGRSVLYVYFSPTQDSFLTVHGNLDVDYDEKSGVHSRSIVCIWNVYNSEEPDKIMTAYGNVKCACFGIYGEFVYGGLTDGTVAVWDVSASPAEEFYVEYDNQIYLPLPSYTTDINCGHNCGVVSVQSLTELTDVGFQRGGNLPSKSSKQICSLDEEGVLIFWAVISKMSNKNEFREVSLVQNSVTSLREVHPELPALYCTDMMVNVESSNHIFISTNYGYIIHCLASGAKPNPTKYSPDAYSKANCLACCPFSTGYFLSGHEDGSVFLYSTAIEKCLKSMNNKANDSEDCKIELLEWSHNKPFIFYSKDNNNVLHIWDLESSDIFPVYSVPFKDKINFFKLSPTALAKDKAVKRSYMVIVSDNGLIHLHLLNGEHGQQPVDKYQEDIKRFFNYVNRL